MNRVDGEVIRSFAALAGHDLSEDRAAALVPGLIPILKGDAAIRRLNLGTLSPLGATWPELRLAGASP
ncbi:hypothetical protein [Deinococcus sp.]|uniref:hypothetical protein n=1 Tax=Deinococcus sp. TaxID=47478 RepID=UPI0025D3FBE3|nr:hypothetical protein [Deinococcus sp.]